MSNQTETLVKMINQIAENTPNNGDNEVVANAVATHVRKFWAKPMKTKVKEYLANNGRGLSDVASKAIKKI